MGVAGSGKTTVGRMVADAIGCPFLDADTLHPPQNVEKMSGGIPLTDADRFGWLSAIRERMVAAATGPESLIVACSALKQSYRTRLAEGLQPTWVYLKASPDLIRSRLRQRSDHFMTVKMAASQFATLEPPSDAIVVDASLAADVIARQVAQRLGSRGHGL